ncbi:MAG: YbaK/EbsC family protein [Phycisphaerales bacterium]|nr:YbaK/EbsC family protein [Phycisphaerae bacterium]NNF44403.1 YbaK/EbsC family protein [Phycisphaerales bacterium]NNM27643.1 YbaK/EbsC family protein [Phycisphaerales bacterium]
MPVQKLKKYLDDNLVPYATITHSPAYTAQGIASVAHIPGRELAKSVIMKVDGRLAMMVLPAMERVDTVAFQHAIGAKRVAIANERDFEDAFPGCEVGAMPPFGNLWDVPVYVGESLTEDELIAFNAGSHTELIQMMYEDFERLVKPTVVPTHAPV